MIVFFYYCDSSRHDIWMNFIDYKVYFMQPMLVYMNIVILTTYLHIKVQYLF